jgi:hypothetical protein
VRAKSRSLLVAVLVTAAIALADAWTGGRAILLSLLLAHAGGRLDDDLALVLAQPRLLLRRAT